jgi:hypothetical protein
MVDYWYNSGETLYTLIQALPHLSPGMRDQVKVYLQQELQNFPPYKYDHIGWTGAARETFLTPPDAGLDNPGGPTEYNYTFRSSGGWGSEGAWGRNPFGFYALWKYAEAFGGAQAILNTMNGFGTHPFWDEFGRQPSDTLLLAMPHVHNAYISGYIGYLGLENLAGQPESTNVKQELNRLLQLRANNFTKDSADGQISSGGQRYCRAFSISNNFIFLVPELAEYLRDHSQGKVTEALLESEKNAPYWFVSMNSEGYGESAISPLYDAHAIYMAKGLILEERGEDLEKYLDVPGFERGDLFYIQKLVVTLDNYSGFSLKANPPFHYVKSGETGTYEIEITYLNEFTETTTISVSPPPPGLNMSFWPTTMDAPGGNVTVVLTDTHNSSFDDAIWYEVPITVNGGEISEEISVHMLINGIPVFMPVMLHQ